MLESGSDSIRVQVSGMDSISGVMEIESVEPFLQPLKDHMYNVEHIPRAFMIAGAILVALSIVWLADRVLVWAVNSKRGEKRRHEIPFYIFPLLLSVAFIIDYISIIFGIFKYPWMSFSVLLIKGSIFLTTSFWAMGVYEVPLIKIFAFLFSAVRAWRTKDIDSLDQSMSDLINGDKDKGSKGKTIGLILVLLSLSCLAPKSPVREGIQVHRSAFSESYLIDRANTIRSSAINEAAEDKPIEGDEIKSIPVYYQGQRVGTFRLNEK